MTLNVWIRRNWHHADTWPQMQALISEVMHNLRPEGVIDIGGVGYPTAGETAHFAFSDRRLLDDADWPASDLCVAVNTVTGYGGLIWQAVSTDPESGDIDHQVWFSSNPEPPPFDPRVVADPHMPTFHRPSNVLPAALIRAALEQYCRTGTGDRPTCVDWVRAGHGQRLDDGP
ncbi:Imm1 family immunity protein [Catellatospora sichuanensis]|uniref:Imm1 family immunity protein n=1 Tax=Catellatospora sichuanensis TaxID=1969805 RepID=UPI001183AE0D|nr:Imm1 family immunity protein [Catellatospora sichuanensis]